jgi:uncharacterized protein YlaN (UPF0358 family)
VHKGSNNT